MKDKKLQVFVSSTFTDLKDERQAAVEAILSAGHIPAGMELFSAGDESQMIVIKRWIEESDVYLLILGGRYGSVEASSGKSYTHLEFEYALELNKPMFAVVISDSALDRKVQEAGRSVLEPENVKELKEFKSIVLSKLVKFFDDRKDIKLAIHETLSDFSYRKELVGWIRGDNAVNTGVLAEEIARLTKENSELRVQLSQGNNNDNALYSNLTYQQLAELLERETIGTDENQITLFDFLLKYAQEFSSGKNYQMSQIRQFNKLILFNIIEEVGRSTGFRKMAFTDEGRKFYLKALYMTQ